MLSTTLSGATLTAPYRGRSAMLRKAKEYRASYCRLRDLQYHDDGDEKTMELHKELYIVHRNLAQGKRLLSVNKAMQIAGCKPNGHPVLAIANAAARWVWFVRDCMMIDDPDGGWRHAACAFVSDDGTHPGWNEKAHIRYYDKAHVFRFVATHFPVRMNEVRISARVPVVPPEVADDFSYLAFRRLAILWEADWQQAPKDPFLLRRITREWYEVLAEWDLTSIERLVLEMAAFAGE